MTIERIFPSGGYVISAFIGNQLMRRRYLGYTRKEAIAEFRAERKALR